MADPSKTPTLIERPAVGSYCGRVGYEAEDEYWGEEKGYSTRRRRFGDEKRDPSRPEEEPSTINISQKCHDFYGEVKESKDVDPRVLLSGKFHKVGENQMALIDPITVEDVTHHRDRNDLRKRMDQEHPEVFPKLSYIGVCPVEHRRAPLTVTTSYGSKCAYLDPPMANVVVMELCSDYNPYKDFFAYNNPDMTKLMHERFQTWVKTLAKKLIRSKSSGYVYIPKDETADDKIVTLANRYAIPEIEKNKSYLFVKQVWTRDNSNVKAGVQVDAFRKAVNGFNKSGAVNMLVIAWTKYFTENPEKFPNLSQYTKTSWPADEVSLEKGIGELIAYVYNRANFYEFRVSKAVPAAARPRTRVYDTVETHFFDKRGDAVDQYDNVYKDKSTKYETEEFKDNLEKFFELLHKADESKHVYNETYAAHPVSFCKVATSKQLRVNPLSLQTSSSSWYNRKNIDEIKFNFKVEAKNWFSDRVEFMQNQLDAFKAKTKAKAQGTEE